MGCNLDATANGATITVTQDSMKAIREMKKPSTEKELRSFIGMFNAIQDHVKNLHLSLGPLYNLLSKLTKLKKENAKATLKDVWTTNHDDLYNEILKLSTSALSIPAYDKEFFIECDASMAGFGCQLYQSDRIIAFASKTLGPAGQRYENAHRETAAVIFALTKFAPFIACSNFPVTVYTDNRVCSFISTSTSPKLRRWKTVIESYNCKLVHKE